MPVEMAQWMMSEAGPLPVEFGPLDVLARDAKGRLDLEPRRGRTPREIVAPALDYGSGDQSLTLDQVSAIDAENSHHCLPPKERS